jgi:hypothetical protein
MTRKGSQVQVLYGPPELTSGSAEPSTFPDILVREFVQQPGQQIGPRVLWQAEGVVESVGAG